MQFESLIVFSIILGILFYLLNRKISEIKNQKNDTLFEWLKSMQASVDNSKSDMVKTLQENSKQLNERLDKAASVIRDVNLEVGKMSEIGRNMRELQEFLKSPKLRGNIGEQVLKELLGQMLPKQSFHLQYSFKSGAMVDAAIKTAAGIIPVDSKFPLENFRQMMAAKNDGEKKLAEKEFTRDVKKHVDDIASKYILTEEGTIDYALMYIPSEAVYYEIVNNSDLFDYAGKKRVLPVSPMTFYAYMKAILMSFEGQKIEARARQILAAIRAIQKDYNRVEENLGVLGNHIKNAYNQMSNVLSGFTLLGQKLTSTQSLGEGTKEELEKGEKK